MIVGENVCVAEYSKAGCSMVKSPISATAIKFGERLLYIRAVRD